ncbi:MAG: MFS transporter [Collinsella sp.]
MGLIWHLALTTGSSSLLSLASLAGFLPIALFGILAGAVVDRLPLKRVLIGADLFIAAVGAALAIASLAGSLPAWLILIALFLRAVGTSFYTPASQSLTPHLAPPEHLVRLSGVTQAIQSGGYILGAALAAVIYPVAGITAMIVLDVLGALFASLAVLAAQIDAGGLDEADRSLSFSNKVRELFSEISDGYKLIREYRGLFALLWCGFVFAFAFSPLAALFPIMTLGHFGGSTGDAALVEILFSAGMLAGSGILAATGGFRNRSFTMVAAIAGFGIAAIVSGSLGPSLFAAFLPVSFLMGACSPLYAGTQTALMQEQIPPEYLGRVFGLYGTIMAWAAHGLAAPCFCDPLELRYGSSALERPWYCLRWLCCLLRASETRGKEIPGRFNSPSIRKKEAAAIGSSVSLQALATTRYCTDIPHRAPYSSPTIIFGFAGLRKVKTLAPAIGQRRKIDVSNLFWHGCASSKTLIHKRRFNLWNS